jgi:hypothetical protein
MQEFYASIGGKCEYETIMSGMGTRTNLIPEAEPLNAVEFWDTCEARFGHSPIYTSWGSFGIVLGLNTSAPNSWITNSCDYIVTLFEQWVNPNAMAGFFKYTDYHDLYCDSYALTPIWPPPRTSRAHIPQWQAGSLEVVWPRGYDMVLSNPTPLPWARKWKIPTWVYSLGETDFAGGDLIPIPPPQLAAEFGVPSGMFGDFTSADRSVGAADMGAATGLWQQTVPWTLLEADMDGNQYIDIDDIARVALDWGKTA